MALLSHEVNTYLLCVIPNLFLQLSARVSGLYDAGKGEKSYYKNGLVFVFLLNSVAWCIPVPLTTRGGIRCMGYISYGRGIITNVKC